MTVEVLWNNN